MDDDRRKFLKIALIGGITLLVKKILDPLFSEDVKNSFTKENIDKFKIVDNIKKLSIYDSSGEEIFQIDKEV